MSGIEVDEGNRARISEHAVAWTGVAAARDLGRTSIGEVRSCFVNKRRVNARRTRDRIAYTLYAGSGSTALNWNLPTQRAAFERPSQAASEFNESWS